MLIVFQIVFTIFTVVWNCLRLSVIEYCYELLSNCNIALIIFVFDYMSIFYI